MQMLSMIAQSSEFENMAVREDELPELDRLLTDACPFDARGGPENKQGKVCILIQVCFVFCTIYLHLASLHASSQQSLLDQ